MPRMSFPTQALSRVGRWLLVGGLVAAALATVAPLSGSPVSAPVAAAAPAGPLPLAGSWRSYANGDRVNRFVRDGDTVWSAAELGGLVRWDMTTGKYRQYLSPQDGLLSNDVNAVALASDRKVWIGTSRALALLDPVTHAVTNYTPESSPGMPARVVTALKVAADGKLWVGFGQEWDSVAVDPVSKLPGTFRNGGLARFDPATGLWDERYHAEIKRSGGIGGDDSTEDYKSIPSENVTDIEISTDGILWVGTRQYYVYDVIVCPPDDSSCTSDGGWVLAGGGLAAKQDDTWATWLPATNEQSCYPSQINDLQADVDGRIWVATAGRGLMLMNKGLRKVGCKNGAQPYYTRPIRDTPGPRGNYVWSVDVAPDGRVWIGHGQGHDEGLGIGILEHNNTFDDSSAANQGQSWRFDDSWEFINLDGGQVESDAVITALDVRGPGPIVLSTKDQRRGDGWGLRLFDYDGDRRWRPLRTADDGLASNQITKLAFNAAKSEMWVTFRNRGVARYDGTVWRTWEAFGKGDLVAHVTLGVTASKNRIPVDLADQAAFDAAFPGSPRYVRFGDDPTQYRLTRSTLTTVGTSKYLDVTPDLQQDLPQGAPVYGVVRGPASNAGSALCFSADGTTWAGGRETIWLGNACPAGWGNECWLDGGLGKFSGVNWQVYDQQTKDVNGKSIPDQEVQACEVDQQGKVWVGSGNARSAEGDGIGRFDPVAGTWTNWKKGLGVTFAGNGVSDIEIDPATGNVWASHHASQDCPIGLDGKTCTLVRLGGGVSRWNGTKWDLWQKPTANLKAFGAQGELASLVVDPGRSRVWAGGWDAVVRNFHWGLGTGVHASLNWCPLDCTNDGWQSKVWPNDGEVAALALDESGNLWAGVNRSGNGIAPPTAGVKIFDGTEWFTYTPANSGLPSFEITALGARGRQMWVGTLLAGVGVYDSVPAQTATPTASATQTFEATPTGGATGTHTAPLPTTPGPSPTPTQTSPPGSGTTPPPTGQATTPGPSATHPTSLPTRVLAIYLPLSQQRLSCGSRCPTPVRTRRPTATRTAVPETPTPTLTLAPTNTAPPPPSDTPTGEPVSATPSLTPAVTEQPPTGTATGDPATATSTADAPTVAPTETRTATASPTSPPGSATPVGPPRAWSVFNEQALPNLKLYSVTGLNNGTVFMVGETGKGYVWDGTQLAQMSINSAQTLRQISFASQTQGYVAADGGYLYETRNGGQSWRIASTGSWVDDWWAVGVFKATEGLRGFALGHGKGMRVFYDGTSWSPPGPDDRNNGHEYTDVAMLSATSAMATRGDASGARMMLWDGTNWSPGPSTGPLYDMHVSSGTLGLAVGYRGAVWRLGAEGKWAVMPQKPNTLGENLNAGHMIAPDNIWVGGGRTGMFHWDGQSWSSAGLRAPQNPAIRSIWMSPDGSQGWAVGDNGLVLRYK